MNETWLPVVGYEGLYEVSDCGRVRGLKRGRILKGWLNSEGRPKVTLCRDDGGRDVHVAWLVIEAFIGPRPPGMHVLHWDDDPANNHILNLRYGTHSENQYDRVRNGNHFRASQTHCVHGHEFTAENTYIRPNGRRVCVECRRRRSREWARQKRNAA